MATRPARFCSSSAATRLAQLEEAGSELEGASSDGAATVEAGFGGMQTSVVGGAVAEIDGVVATDGCRGHIRGTTGTVGTIKVALRMSAGLTASTTTVEPAGTQAQATSRRHESLLASATGLETTVLAPKKAKMQMAAPMERH